MKRREFSKCAIVGGAALAGFGTSALAAVARGLVEVRDEPGRLLRRPDNMMVKTVEKFFENSIASVLREPGRGIRERYIVPGGPSYNDLWDWDAYFICLAIGRRGWHKDYVLSTLKAFFALQGDDGYIPYSSYYRKEDPKKTRQYRNPAKPILGQWALYAGELLQDFEWLRPLIGKLKAFYDYWEREQKSDYGLFVLRSLYGAGSDNNPGHYGRPLNSVAAVELNCWMVRDFEAMKKIAERLSLPELAKEYEEKGKVLADRVNKFLWDPVDEIYYNADVLTKTPLFPTPMNQRVNWVVPLKFKTFYAFMPMWAGIAPKERADILVKKHLLNKREFWGDYGVYGLARNEPLYNVCDYVKGTGAPASWQGTPSNWQGPVWICVNYFIFKGLLNYGFIEPAEEIYNKTIRTLAGDIKETGTIHEAYDGDTGKGLMIKDYISLNIPVLLMKEELDKLKTGP